LRSVTVDVEDWTKTVLNHLLTGGIAAIPTDTLYGLAASLDTPTGILRLFKIKNRPLSKPIPLLFASFEMAIDWGFEKTSGLERLAGTFWPGPLTIVLQRPECTPEWFAPGNSKIAVRVPAHPVARRLLEKLKVPLAVTSANRSGEAPCRNVGEIEKAFGGEGTLFIVRGGYPPAGEPSTVIEVTGVKPVLLRKGVLPFEKITEVFSDGSE